MIRRVLVRDTGFLIGYFALVGKTQPAAKARVEGNWKNRVAAPLLLAIALVTSLGWTTEAWGQTGLPRVGILSYGGETHDEVKQSVEPFRRTLAERGWVEGQQVAFEYRRAVGDLSQLAEAAADLTRMKVDVIFADSAPSLRAAHAATNTIPIVGVDLTTDPIAEGYVKTYTRSGTNITGIFLDAPAFSGKWIELLKAIVPNLSRAIVLWDPSPGAAHLEAVKGIARSSGLQLQVIEVRKPGDISRAFSAFRGRPQALIILPSPMMYLQSEQLAKLTLKHRLPATSMAPAFAKAGGALAYGPDDSSIDERSAALVAKILGGAKPGDLPVERPSKFKFVVNMKTAKTLGLTIPQSILLQADQVIR
jgi:putative ABC transport system substrate-binding protein